MADTLNLTVEEEGFTASHLPDQETLDSMKDGKPWVTLTYAQSFDG